VEEVTTGEIKERETEENAEEKLRKITDLTFEIEENLRKVLEERCLLRNESKRLKEKLKELKRN